MKPFWPNSDDWSEVNSVASARRGLSPAAWRRLNKLSRLSAYIGFVVFGFMMAKIDGLHDFEGMAQLFLPAMVSFLGLTFEIGHPKPAEN